MKRFFVALTAAALILVCRPASAQLSSQQQKNLTAFTRLYGYTRFFHPSDEAAELDWNAFAIYGVQKIMEAKDDKALLGSLRELFGPMAPTIVLYPETANEKFSSAAITPPDTGNYRPVAWQHFGVGLTAQSVYKSIRTNRPIPERSTAQGFAPVSQIIPADRVKGKEFRFSGWMKVDSTWGGSGYFWIRVQKKGQVVFFYNMSNRPVTSNTWKEYSFTGQADKDADTIALGAFLSGKGSLLIDHLRLSVKEGETWKEVPLENSGFETDSASQPKGWRYNHLLAGYRFASVKGDAYDGVHALAIVSIKDSIQRSKTIVRPIFDQYPKPGEYIQSTLVPGIACIVPIALYGTRVHTYPIADPAALARLEQALALTTGTSGDSLAVRLGDVVIVWNIFRHFFPYWEDASATPEQLLDKALAKAAMDKDRFEFLQTLRLMTAPLNDGHIYVSMQDEFKDLGYTPITLAKAENRIVIEQVLDSSLLAVISPGDIVKAINGRVAEEYVDSIAKTVSGSPQYVIKRALSQAVIGPRRYPFNLTLEKTDQTIAIPRNGHWSGAYLSSPATKHVSGWIRPGVFYIDLDRDPMDSINSWMPQLEQAKAIVCDLRGYPRANHELIDHFLTKTEDTRWMFVPQVNYPDYQHVTYKELGWNLHPVNPHLMAKVFFLTDGRAISYAESYMGFIKDFHLATIVGEPTAGTNGNINPFDLPGGYKVSWTGMLVKDHEGGKHHLKGIVPDVTVSRTIKGIRDGKDEVLDKALELAGQ